MIHIANHGRKMFVIESKYGNDGYAVWFKLIEELGKADHHFIDLRDETQLMFLASMFKVSEERLQLILSDLAKLDAINKELFEKHQTLFEDFWYTCLDLGHLPTNDEFEHSGLYSYEFNHLSDTPPLISIKNGWKRMDNRVFLCHS